MTVKMLLPVLLCIAFPPLALPALAYVFMRGHSLLRPMYRREWAMAGIIVAVAMVVR